MPLPVDPSRYVAFLGVMAAMAFAPGPANVFSIANGMGRGKRAALLGVAGMNAATLIWFIGAAVGLGALVAAFPRVFYALGFAGALYIAWLAVTHLRTAFSAKMAPLAKIQVTKRSPFTDGFLVQVANPKVLLFFTAVLPPFLDVSRPMMPQMLIYAAGTFTLDVIAMSGYGLGGATLSRRAEDPRFRRGFALAVGILLLTAAALIMIDRIESL